MFTRVISSYWIAPLWLCSVLLYLLLITLVLKSIFSDVNTAAPAFFLFHLHEISFSNPLLLVCVYLLTQDGSLGGSIYMGLVFLSIQLPYVFWLEHLSHLHLRWLLIGMYVMPFYCSTIFLFFIILFFSSFS